MGFEVRDLSYYTTLPQSFLPPLYLQNDIESLAPRPVHKTKIPPEEVVDAGDVFELTQLEEEEDGGENARFGRGAEGGREG